jgi:hypothetical protein
VNALRAAFLVCLLPITQGHAMGLFGKKAVLFSALSGTITAAHKPVAGARVLRSVQWNAQTYKDEASTDQAGRFQFDEMPAPGRSGLSQFAAFQSIEVEYQGKKTQIWRLAKMDPDPDKELVDFRNHKSGGVPIAFTCELAAPMQKIELLMGVLATSCSFPVKVGEVIE